MSTPITGYWPFGELRPASYDLIVCDPPWNFKTYSPKGWGKSAQRHYSCMTIDDIRALPVGQLASPDCALFLWATAPMLLSAIKTMEAWDFEYKSFAVWVKTTKHGKISFGTGYRLRNSHEPILLGVKGNPKNTRSERSAILAQVREHSQKPDAFYDMCERWLPSARRVDLFSRTSRAGWTTWGDQAGEFDEAAA